MKIINLTKEQINEIDDKLAEYDEAHITYKLDSRISIGIEEDGHIVAGLDACMTAFKILYVSTVFVDERYRRKGYGKALIEEMEARAKALGANTIRLDTFNWQGKDFYLALGYQQVGYYRNEDDNYEEYFFVKRI
jgi:GNAT superfamily N-acetyltransferase